MIRLLIFFLFLMWTFPLESQLYLSRDNTVKFTSEAPLETIIAESSQLSGVLNLSNKEFAFKIPIKTFDGFNNSLQKIHFYENYMEVSDYPDATFEGKILEDISYDRNSYRAKGILKIHGQEQERILDVDLFLSEDAVRFEARFTVPLDDHSIELPRIVYQKIAESIVVEVKGKLIAQK